MGKCKKCGTVVSSPKKKWTTAGRPSKAGKRTRLEIGLFDCPTCKEPFREVLSKKTILARRRRPKKAKARALITYPQVRELPYSNETYGYLYINYTHSEHTIEISGTTIIPEFPSFLVLPLFMMATLLAVIVYRRKRCQTDWAE